MKFALPLVLALAIGVLLASGIGKDPRKLPSPLIGKPIPEFTLPRLHEPDVQLASEELIGAPFLLNVWGSWCAGCFQEHEEITTIAESNIVPVIGLNWRDERTDAVAWLRRMGDPYALHLHDLSGRVGVDFGVYGAPETFLIDESGRIAAKHIGIMTADVWREDFLPLLNSTSP